MKYKNMTIYCVEINGFAFNMLAENKSHLEQALWGAGIDEHDISGELGLIAAMVEDATAEDVAEILQVIDAAKEQAIN